MYKNKQGRKSIIRMLLLMIIYTQGINANNNGEKELSLKEKFLIYKTNNANSPTGEFKIYSIYKTNNNPYNIKKNSKKAKKWLISSAEHNNIKAQLELYELYLTGELRTKKDTKKAFYWLLKAAENKSSEAMFKIGTFYEAGAVVKQDYEKALYWYLKSYAYNKNQEVKEKLIQIIKNGKKIGYQEYLIKTLTKLRFKNEKQ